MLVAIASLHSELYIIKREICDKIDESIADVEVTLRAEITTLRTETDVSIMTLKAQVDSQAKTLNGLAKTTDAADLETQVKS